MSIRDFLAQDVNAIIVSPGLKIGFGEILNTALQHHKPVVLIDRRIDAPEWLYSTVISADFYDEGRRAGEWLRNEFPGGARVAEIEGESASQPAIERKEGFRSTLAKSGGFEIVDAGHGNFTREGGKSAAREILKTTEGAIDAIFAHNDEMALGALEAIEDVGLHPGADVKIVSVGGSKEGLEALAEGKLNFVMESSPQLAPRAFDAIEAIWDGEAVVKHIVLDGQNFDQQRAREALQQRAF